MPDMRTHDLRRTLRTFLGEQGIPDKVADRVLNHARPGVGNQHYNHAKMLPQVRAALEVWAAHVEAACTEALTKQLPSMADANPRLPATDEGGDNRAAPLAAA